MTRATIFAAVKAARPGQPSWKPEEIALLDGILTRFGIPKEDAVLQPSDAIEAFVRDIEKLAKVRVDGLVQAYLPTPNDVPTIGYGSTGPDITMKTVWTKAQCEARFAIQFDQFAEGVRLALGAAPTTQGQFDAMVSLAYNIGIGGFRDSTLLRKHKEGNYDGAAAEFARWNKQAGVILNGLTKRRAAETRFYKGLSA